MKFITVKVPQGGPTHATISYYDQLLNKDINLVSESTFFTELSKLLKSLHA